MKGAYLGAAALTGNRPSLPYSVSPNSLENRFQTCCKIQTRGAESAAQRQRCCADSCFRTCGRRCLESIKMFCFCFSQSRASFLMTSACAGRYRCGSELNTGEITLTDTMSSTGSRFFLMAACPSSRWSGWSGRIFSVSANHLAINPPRQRGGEKPGVCSSSSPRNVPSRRFKWRKAGLAKVKRLLDSVLVVRRLPGPISAVTDELEHGVGGVQPRAGRIL